LGLLFTGLVLGVVFSEVFFSIFIITKKRSYRVCMKQVFLF